MAMMTSPFSRRARGTRDTVCTKPFRAKFPNRLPVLKKNVLMQTHRIGSTISMAMTRVSMVYRFRSMGEAPWTTSSLFRSLGSGIVVTLG